MTINLDGWIKPTRNQKRHYFVNGVPLCGVNFFSEQVESVPDNDPQNCKSCQRAKLLYDMQTIMENIPD